MLDEPVALWLVLGLYAILVVWLFNLDRRVYKLEKIVGKPFEFKAGIYGNMTNPPNKLFYLTPLDEIDPRIMDNLVPRALSGTRPNA